MKRSKKSEESKGSGIKRALLLEALGKVRPALAGKEIIEHTTNVGFNEGVVMAYNDALAISHPSPLTDLSQVMVSADELYKLLSKVNDEFVEVSVVESELRLKMGRRKAGIPLIDGALPGVGSVGKWKKLPEGFLEALKFAVPICSNDASRPEFTCVHVHDDVVESTDNYRICRHSIGDHIGVPAFLLPATSGKILTQYYKVDSIARGDGWIHFKSTEAGTLISSRIVGNEEFPDISRFIAVAGQQIHLPDSLNEILERAGLFAKKEFSVDEVVMLFIKGKVLTIRGESDRGWYEETTPIEYKGPEVSFSIHPELLAYIVRYAQQGVISESTLCFAGADWQYVASLVTGEE